MLVTEKQKIAIKNLSGFLNQAVKKKDIDNMTIKEASQKIQSLIVEIREQEKQFDAGAGYDGY